MTAKQYLSQLAREPEWITAAAAAAFVAGQAARAAGAASGLALVAMAAGAAAALWLRGQAPPAAVPPVTTLPVPAPRDAFTSLGAPP